MSNKDKELTVKDYSNKKSFNDLPCKDDEVLIPFLAHKEIKNSSLCNPNNLETWNFNGKKVVVGFMQIKKVNAVKMMEFFWEDVNQYMKEKSRKKRCYVSNDKGVLIRCPKEKKCENCPLNGNPNVITSMKLSLHKIMDDINSSDGNSYDPSSGTEDIIYLRRIIFELIQEVKITNEKYARILELLYEGYEKKEILEKLSLGKSQGYVDIKRAQAMIKQMYYE